MALFSDLELDPETNDLVIGRDLTVIPLTPDAITQRLRVVLQSFKGEWFLNLDYGVPYFQNILKKGVTRSQVDNILRGQIKETDGVDSITTFESSLNKSTRDYSLTFSCIVETGETITITI